MVVGREREMYQRPHSYHPMDKTYNSIDTHTFARRTQWGMENKENINVNLNNIKLAP